jgi:16S rRNA (uracil1498-N3)-methyltransferase
MTLVFSRQIEKDIAILDAEEGRHLVQVLRKKVGDQVQVTDGNGHSWEAEIADITKKGVYLQLTAEIKDDQPDKPKIHIAIVPPKQGARFEWFLEKVTEIGVFRVTILQSERSERNKWRADRLEKILIAAMKQSAQTRLPELVIEDQDVRQLILAANNSEGNKLIATCDWGNLKTLSDVYTPGQDTLILIGPEGDFSPGEVAFAKQNGFLPILLGTNRLRTETAGVVACAQINLLNEKN